MAVKGKVATDGHVNSRDSIRQDHVNGSPRKSKPDAVVNDSHSQATQERRKKKPPGCNKLLTVTVSIFVRDSES